MREIIPFDYCTCVDRKLYLVKDYKGLLFLYFCNRHKKSKDYTIIKEIKVDKLYKYNLRVQYKNSIKILVEKVIQLGIEDEEVIKLIKKKIDEERIRGIIE